MKPELVFSTDKYKNTFSPVRNTWKWKGNSVLLEKLHPNQLEHITNTLNKRKGVWFGYPWYAWIHEIKHIEQIRQRKQLLSESAFRKESKINTSVDRFLINFQNHFPGQLARDLSKVILEEKGLMLM